MSWLAVVDGEGRNCFHGGIDRRTASIDPTRQRHRATFWRSHSARGQRRRRRSRLAAWKARGTVLGVNVGAIYTS
jgi:hypothetical protein